MHARIAEITKLYLFLKFHYEVFKKILTVPRPFNSLEPFIILKHIYSFADYPKRFSWSIKNISPIIWNFKQQQSGNILKHQKFYNIDKDQNLHFMDDVSSLHSWKEIQAQINTPIIKDNHQKIKFHFKSRKQHTSSIVVNSSRAFFCLMRLSSASIFFLWPKY